MSFFLPREGRAKALYLRTWRQRGRRDINKRGGIKLLSMLNLWDSFRWDGGRGGGWRKIE